MLILVLCISFRHCTALCPIIVVLKMCFIKIEIDKNDKIFATHLQNVRNNTYRPAVHCIAVRFLCQDLRSWNRKQKHQKVFRVLECSAWNSSTEYRKRISCLKAHTTSHLISFHFTCISNLHHIHKNQCNKALKVL